MSSVTNAAELAARTGCVDARRNGHRSRMDVKKPVEKTTDLALEAERGRSERTPWLALGGVATTITAVLVILGAVVLTIYWLA